MPRSPSKRIQEQKNNAEEKLPENKPKCDQTVMIMKDSLCSSSDVQVIKLKHPRTESPAVYVLDNNQTKLFEMITFDEGHRSWFLGSKVMSDGRLYLVSPVDIIYLVLPYLMKAERNIPIDHLLEDADYPDIHHLGSLAKTKDLSHVADQKGSPDLGVWRYNEELTLKWLANKVEKLAVLLQDKKIPTSAAQSFTFVRTANRDQTEEAYKALAHGIVSDYLPEQLSSALHKHLKLPEIANKQKAAKGAENEPPLKKPKVEGPTEDYSKTKVEGDKTKTPQTAKAKALAKSAAGSKNIMSFFGKK
ncbi:ribonuclease H2 subunit B [Palaemon carinicauda]|uniref:ribonuclease H2 subunit B n=1 Tax=Palaemon carinicauda TaxID=392227 RepID=UPI0035B691F2